jgi:diguanylate cyclase
MQTDARAEALVSGIVDLARRLRASVIAEGVESPIQVSMLRQMGCDHAQGFHFAAPLSAVELEAALVGPAGAQRTGARHAWRPGSTA